MRSEQPRLIIHALASGGLQAFFFFLREKKCNISRESAAGKLQNFYTRKKSLGRFSLPISQLSSARKPREITEPRFAFFSFLQYSTFTVLLCKTGSLGNSCNSLISFIGKVDLISRPSWWTLVGLYQIPNKLEPWKHFKKEYLRGQLSAIIIGSHWQLPTFHFLLISDEVHGRDSIELS